VTYSTRRLVAAGVAVVALSSFVVMSHMFLVMYVTGQTSIMVYADKFREFKLELAIVAVAHVALPVLLYELTEPTDEAREDDR
jgi:hypothetical protein